MKKTSAILFIALSILIWASAFAAPQAKTPAPAWQDMKGPGKKIWIDDTVYFIYRPSEKPKLGTVILKVQVFQKPGKKDLSFTIQGEFGMPSMPGAHDSGLQTFSLNKSGNYLLPLNIVMPGEWELKLTFLKGGKTVFRGRVKFNV